MVFVIQLLKCASDSCSSSTAYLSSLENRHVIATGSEEMRISYLKDHFDGVVASFPSYSYRMDWKKDERMHILGCLHERLIAKRLVVRTAFLPLRLKHLERVVIHAPYVGECSMRNRSVFTDSLCDNCDRQFVNAYSD